MATGDGKTAAAAVAKQLGIDEFYGEVRPQDKSDLVAGLKAEGRRVAMRSMIPHHAGAILMCEEASIQDQRVRDLCQNIQASQKEEIAQMKALLADVAKD